MTTCTDNLERDGRMAAESSIHTTIHNHHGAKNTSVGKKIHQSYTG